MTDEVEKFYVACIRFLNLKHTLIDILILSQRSKLLTAVDPDVWTA